MCAAAVVGLTGACANQSPPPGGPEDRRPPIVIRTVPDTFGTLQDLDGSVRFEFDERISESTSEGDLSSAVSVSPLTGDVEVGKGRSSLSVSLEGGFRPGLVYRVTLQPVVSDLFGNRMTEAFEVVFSTGGAPAQTATLAGEVWDRVSGRGVSGAVVRALGDDSLVHVARADQAGIFAFRYLPAGDFVLTGFQDQDRNREVSARESRGSTGASLSVADTVLVDIPILAPDTTPAVPARASALDSVTIVVEFDDYLDPASAADQIGIRLTRDEETAPVVTRLFHEPEYVRYVAEVQDSLQRLDSVQAAEAAAAPPTQAAVDSAAADSAASADPTVVPPADSTAAPPADSTAVQPGGAGAEPPAAPAAPGAGGGSAGVVQRGPPRLPGTATSPPSTPPGRTLPGRRLVGLLDGPLSEGEYDVRVTAVVNINGLGGGAGDVVLVFEPPEPPAPDSVTQDPGGDAAAPDGAPAGDPADPGAGAGGVPPPAPDSLGLFP